VGRHTGDLTDDDGAVGRGLDGRRVPTVPITAAERLVGQPIARRPTTEAASRLEENGELLPRQFSRSPVCHPGEPHVRSGAGVKRQTVRPR
jgi:hypothetical protein